MLTPTWRVPKLENSKTIPELQNKTTRHLENDTFKASGSLQTWTEVALVLRLYCMTIACMQTDCRRPFSLTRQSENNGFLLIGIQLTTSNRSTTKNDDHEEKEPFLRGQIRRNNVTETDNTGGWQWQMYFWHRSFPFLKPPDGWMSAQWGNVHLSVMDSAKEKGTNYACLALNLVQSMGLVNEEWVIITKIQTRK